MKTKLRLNVLVGSILVAVFSTFFSQNLMAQQRGSTYPIATYNNGSSTWNFDETLLQEDFENYWNITISSMVIEYVPGENSLLMVEAVDTNNVYSGFAITIEGIANPTTGLVDIYFKEFDASGQPGLFGGLFDKHSCKGNGCSHCKYSRNNGCECLQGNGSCDHSVEYATLGDVLIKVATLVLGII